MQSVNNNLPPAPSTASPLPLMTNDSDRNYCTRALSAIANILYGIWEKFVYLITCACFRAPPQTTASASTSASASAPPQRTQESRPTTVAPPATAPAVASSEPTRPSTPTPPLTTSEIATPPPPASSQQAQESTPAPAPSAPVSTVVPRTPLEDRYRDGFIIFVRQHSLGLVYEDHERVADEFFRRLAPYQNSITNIEFLPASGGAQQYLYRFNYVRITTDRADDIGRALGGFTHLRGDMLTGEPAREIQTGFRIRPITRGTIPESRSDQVLINLDYMSSKVFYDIANASSIIDAMHYRSRSSLEGRFEVSFQELVKFQEFLAETTIMPRDTIITVADKFFQMIAPYEAQVTGIKYIVRGLSNTRESLYIRIETRGQPPAELVSAFRALPEWARHNNVITYRIPLYGSHLSLESCRENEVVIHLFATGAGRWSDAFTRP